MPHAPASDPPGAGDDPCAPTAERPRFIAVAGTIGAGKTTFVQLLERRWGIAPFYEPNDNNPYLTDFYQDMPRWAFHSQVWFLGAKFDIHQRASAQAADRAVVLDRTIYEDAEIFARNLYESGGMTERDWATYAKLYDAILSQLPPPDLLVYLRCTVKAAQRRIRLRGRPSEQQLPANYLKRLHALYEDWFGRYGHGQTLVVDTDRVDYVNDLVWRLDLTERIEALVGPRAR